VTAAGDDATLVRGVVHDSAGAAVGGVTVRPMADGARLPVVETGTDGAFAFDPRGVRSGNVVVDAPGFERVERRWSMAGQPLVIVLAPAHGAEEVTVTAARATTRLADTASRVIVIAGRDLQSTAAPTLDDVLRQVPGFSLFRRSDSRVANPTAQGASLRGVGASGASRSLVLLDGVPLNDSFGGWVYWSREPRVAVDRVEVLEGGASDLYGSAALGGVIQAIERSDAPAFAVEASGGSLGTGDLAAYGAVRKGAWSLRGSGEAFSSDGYILVAPDQRGTVDTAAGGSHVAGTLTVERRRSPGVTIFARAAALGESRANGTPLQVNDTDWRQLSVGADASNEAGVFSARAWYGSQVYHQSFSAVSADRATETLTRLQRVPAENAGASVQWSRGLGRRNAVLAGLDARWVEGRSDEVPYARGSPAAFVSAGGHDRTVAFFASDRMALGDRAVATLGARVDRWSGGDHGVTALSPRASVLLRLSRRLSLTAAGYGAFRSPTLNELYRSFRVGNVVTLANASLTVERLKGGEAGLVWSLPDERLRIRAVAFTSWITDPIANVTLRASPDLVTRERENLGSSRSRGLELDAEAPLGPWLRLTAGYALVDATVTTFPSSPEIEGNRLPQVPRHQATLAARFGRPSLFDLGVEVRATSGQFEDDQNQLPLAGYATLDARIARRLGRATLFAVVENLSGTRYAVGLTPTPTLGPPRSFRAGLRFE
jgi:iron complex outermembrane recepter protein